MTEPDGVALRDYVDAMFAEKEKALQAALLAQEKAVAAALEASDKAITKAEDNAEKWRENANEWRGAMSDRDRELPSRREVETANAAIEARLTAVEKRQDHGSGRTEGISITVGTFLAGLAGLSTVVGLVVVIANLLTAHP